MPDVQPMAVQTRGLAKAFGRVPAVAGLDLDVPSGAMFGLVGPDGAGKSTAIRLLCGILKPDAGAATVLDCALPRDRVRLKRQIGYLSQSFTLYGDLTVDENIEFFARIHDVRDFRQRREELLDVTRLAPFRRRLADRLSGGMKKKLALACTLIHTPRAIFLDEPSTGVDPVSRGEFWNILSGVVERGVTVFLTTPYLDEAERCGRISLMHRGRIARSGEPSAIKAGFPGEVYDLTCPAPQAAYQALRRRRPASHLVVYGERLHFWARNGRREAEELAGEVEASGQGPATLTRAAPSLEDAFVALVASGLGEEKHARASEEA